MDDVYLKGYTQYNDYLDSFLKTSDKMYIPNVNAQRMIVELNYRPVDTVLSHEEFYQRRARLIKKYSDENKEKLHVELETTYNDELIRELAIRDMPNERKIISTLIFMSVVDKLGFEVSGFIDFEESRRLSIQKPREALNWDEIYKGKKSIRPRPTDLSFLEHHSGRITHNDTNNYVTIIDKGGLSFMFRGDHKKLTFSMKGGVERSKFFKKTVVISEKYGYVELFDHLIRKKC